MNPFLKPIKIMQVSIYVIHIRDRLGGGDRPKGGGVNKIDK